MLIIYNMVQMLVDERCNARSPSLESYVPNSDTDSLKNWIIAHIFLQHHSPLNGISWSMLLRHHSKEYLPVFLLKLEMKKILTSFILWNSHNNNTIGLVIHWCKTLSRLGISRINVLRISIPNQNLQI